MRKGTPQRGYTVLRNLAIAFVITLASFLVAKIFEQEGLLGEIGIYCLPIGLIGSVVAPILGVVFPVRTGTPISNRHRNFALIGWLGALEALAVLVVGVWLGYEMYMSGRKVDDTFVDRKAMGHDRVVSRFPLDYLVPKEAKDISFKGSTGIAGLGWQAEFSCHVSESDFEAFAASHVWRLATNCFENANAATADSPCAHPFWSDTSSKNPFCGEHPPKRFVSYYYLKSNYGGIVLALDLDTGILYGQYSSN